MGSKQWMVLLMMAMVLIVSKASSLSDAASWGLAHQGKDMHGLDVDSEMLMSSGSSHRMLQQKGRFISYDQMKKNKTPCNRKGRSYYNCKGHKKANPYRRGCSAITMCYRYTY